MIAAFTKLRFLATLRRIAKAIEHSNRLEQHRQEVEYKRVSPAASRKVTISRPSVDSWNARAAGIKDTEGM